MRPHSSVTIGAIFVARKVAVNSKSSWCGPGHFRFDAQSVVTHENTEISHLTYRDTKKRNMHQSVGITSARRERVPHRTLKLKIRIAEWNNGTRTIVLTPRISHNPVLLASSLVRSPPHDRYNVVDHHIPNGSVVDHPTGIIQNGVGVDTRGDRSACKNLCFNLAGDRTESTRVITVRSVLGNRSVGKAVNGLTAAG